MLKRLFFVLLGLGAGVTLGAWSVRKVDEAARRLSPDHLAQSATARAGSLGERLAAAIDEGRRAAAEREDELRRTYEVRPEPPPTPAD